MLQNDHQNNKCNNCLTNFRSASPTLWNCNGRICCQFHSCSQLKKIQLTWRRFIVGCFPKRTFAQMQALREKLPPGLIGWNDVNHHVNVLTTFEVMYLLLICRNVILWGVWLEYGMRSVELSVICRNASFTREATTRAIWSFVFVAHLYIEMFKSTWVLRLVMVEYGLRYVEYGSGSETIFIVCKKTTLNQHWTDKRPYFAIFGVFSINCCSLVHWHYITLDTFSPIRTNFSPTKLYNHTWGFTLIRLSYGVGVWVLPFTPRTLHLYIYPYPLALPCPSMVKAPLCLQYCDLTVLLYLQMFITGPEYLVSDPDVKYVSDHICW